VCGHAVKDPAELLTNTTDSKGVASDLLKSKHTHCIPELPLLSGTDITSLFSDSDAHCLVVRPVAMVPFSVDMSTLTSL